MNDPLVGRTLGDFRIERFISKGSAGRVYEATQVTLNRRVALKVLEEGIFTPQDFRIRFQREAEYLARLEHPNVVPIYTAGTDGKYTFYAMRFVEGRTLDHLMGEGLAVRDGLRYLADIAGALAYIHENEIIHRDLKPSNIMVSDDSAMLTDFGIARFMQTTTITDTGTLLGTPLYMSPEQARREKATAASDLYAVGVIAYELCACRHPFMDRRREPDQARDTIFKRIAEGLCESPRAWIPEIPGRLEAILLEAMALEPEARPAGAAALRALLQEAAGLPGLDRLDAARERALGIRVTTEPGPARPRILVGEPAPKPDGEVFGDYVLQAELGRGGMGVVYKAVQRGLDRVVAVKILPFGSDSEGVERFRREAAAAANLRHPNIVTVHEAGRVEDRHYYAMEFIEGESLETLLGRERPPARRTMEIVRDVARAIRYAHEQGVIHRDLKPGNVLLDAQGRVLIADFGLAKLTGSRPLTVTGAVMGTPAYMAPEQAQGRPTDARTDVYGIGALLYHLLTGVKPFPDRDPLEMLVDVIATEPTPPRALNPKVHPDAETICLRAMEKEPARRYSTAAELLDDVERFLDGEPIRARPVGRLSRAWRRLRRRPAAMAAVGAVLVVIVVAAVALVVQSLRYAAERDAIEHVRWAESNFRAGNLDEADRRAALALDRVADFGPAHFWRGRVALRRYQEHRRLPAVWRTYGDVTFSPVPPETPGAASLRRTVQSHFASAGGLGGWERSFADGALALFDGRAEEAAARLDETLAAYRLEAEPFLMAATAHFHARRFDHAQAVAREGRERWAGDLALLEVEARATIALALQALLSGVDPQPSCDAAVDLCAIGGALARGEDRWPALTAQAHTLRAEYADSTGQDPDEHFAAALDALEGAAGPEALVARGDALLDRTRAALHRGVNLPVEPAIEAYDAAVAASPADPGPRFKRAEAYWAHAEIDSLEGRDTRDLVRRALEDYAAAPEFIDARLGCARIDGLLARADATTPEEGIAACLRTLDTMRRSIAERPGDPRISIEAATAYTDLALYRMSAGRPVEDEFDEAIRVMDRAIELRPNVALVYFKRGQAHANLAHVLLLRDDPAFPSARDAALADLERAIELNPLLADAYLAVGSVQANEAVWLDAKGRDPADRYRDGLAAYDRVLRVNPRSARAFLARGMIYASWARSKDPPEPRLDLLDRAVAEFDRALDVRPEDRESLIGRIKALNLRFDLLPEDAAERFELPNETLRWCERLVNRSPAEFEGYFQTGEAHLRCARIAPALGLAPDTWWKNAEDAYTGALQIRPSHARALEQRGLMRFHLGDYEAALPDLERAVDLDPSREETLRPFIERCRDF